MKYDTIKIIGRSRVLYVKKTSKSNNPIKYILHQGNMITYKQFCKHTKVIKGGGLIGKVELTNSTVQDLINLVYKFNNAEQNQRVYLRITAGHNIFEQYSDSLYRRSTVFADDYKSNLFKHFEKENDKTIPIKDSYIKYNQKAEDLPITKIEAIVKDGLNDSSNPSEFGTTL